MISKKLSSITARYRNRTLRESVIQLVVTLSCLFFFYSAGMISLQYSYYLLALLFAVPTGLFLARTFVIQHDCGHGAFFRSRRANHIIGACLAILSLTPYQRWRRIHAVHHVDSGNLDKRGCGDIDMLTVEEYLNLKPMQRWLYRLYRNPLILFGIAPLLFFCVQLRRTHLLPKAWRKERNSVYLTNLVIVLILIIAAYIGQLTSLLLFHLTASAVGALVGVWLFYIQHQFPEVYWQRTDKWERTAAAIEGSSFYDLPRVLHWLTAYIGFHHIHHLDPQIPNYRLKKCYEENPEFQQCKKLSVWDSFACAKLALWDESQQQLIRFKDLALLRHVKELNLSGK